MLTCPTDLGGSGFNTSPFRDFFFLIIFLILGLEVVCVSSCYRHKVLLGNAAWPDMIHPRRVKIELAVVCFIWTLLLCISPSEIWDLVTTHLFSPWSCLEKTAIFKVFFDDDVRHGIEHNLDVLCVCGTGHVAVDFFHALFHVQFQELRLDVVAGIVICVGA